MPPTDELAIVKFRANPAYELVLFDRLPPEAQQQLSGLDRDPDLYGVLRPREGSGLAFKSVCRETALLFLTLREPGPLPAYVKADRDGGWRQSVAALILDGIIEIETMDGFRSGADACQLVCGETPTASAGGLLARLSVEALKYAQRLELRDPLRLSARLYFYNRQPASQEWHRDFPTANAVSRHLGIQEGSLRPVLEELWSPVPTTPPLDGWMMWRSRGDQLSSAGRARYKLYVSPDTRLVSEAFRTTVRVLADLPLLRLKVGRDVYGLLRPDKIVAYFRSRENLQEAAERLRSALDGMAAHGVPFSAELGGDGLLSWGIDPPSSQRILVWQERESWRLWLTNRLATALLAARATPTRELEPWQFALERLRLQGVDPVSWTPIRALWSETSESGA